MERRIKKKKLEKGKEEKIIKYDEDLEHQVIIKLSNTEGNILGHQIVLDSSTTKEEIENIINKELNNLEILPYSAFIDDVEITSTIDNALKKTKYSAEQTIIVTYKEEALFYVKPVTRPTATLEGHLSEILCLAFSPNSKLLASGSGDCNVRIWDVNTETPLHKFEYHKNWVLALSWNPDSQLLASGDKLGLICIWYSKQGKMKGTLKGHKNFITSFSWIPMHKNKDCTILASSSKDGIIIIWDVISLTPYKKLSGHLDTITRIIWGGEGHIFSCSHDKTIKIWSDNKYCQIGELKGHGHWVNHISLSTEYVLRTSCFDPDSPKFNNREEMKEYALKRYEKVIKTVGEILVSGSDDNTLFIWKSDKNGKFHEVCRMTGHQQLINQVIFSPDSRIIASCSFDKSIKLWDANTGKFKGNLRGHVGAVYQIAWSADSRRLISGSKDSTLKVWNISKMKLEYDLPGHSDEIYSVDWSPDGEKAASGSKDHILRIWRN